VVDELNLGVEEFGNSVPVAGIERRVQTPYDCESLS
jgi:hypothetical protein